MNRPIYELIAKSVENGRLPDGFSLPEEEDSAPVKFAPGAFDGICIYHMGLDELDDEGRQALGTVLQSASAGDRERTDALFYEWTKKHRAFSMVDEIQQYVRDHADELNIGYLFQSAKHMILYSSHVECVKIGLELLELFKEPSEEIKTAIRTLGLCDEFTMFSVWNLRKWEDGNEEVFALAQKVHGWGRIHAVEFLQPDTDAIRRWLLAEGAVNDVMAAYSALTVWEKSEAEKLLRGKPSAEEYKAILRLAEGLLDEGPCPGISRLEEPEKTMLRMLELAPEYALTPEDWDLILAVKRWAESEESPHPSVAAACDALLHSSACTETVRAAAKKGEALELAAELGLPFREDLLRCLREDFDRHCANCRFLLSGGEYYVQQTLNIFREKLPFDKIKGDPVDDPCWGEANRHFDLLQYLLQELDGMPLAGADLVKAGLESRVSRNRSRALAVLQAWVSGRKTPLYDLSPTLFLAVKLLQEREIDPGNKETIAALLEGKTEFGEEE